MTRIKDSNMIMRRIKVDRRRTPQQVLDATDRFQNTPPAVVALMPRRKGEEIELFFFKAMVSVATSCCAPGIYTKDLEREFKARNLEPDPYGQAAVNETDPAFADTHPNATIWKDVDGNHYETLFCQERNNKRYVLVDCARTWWNDCWWFCGRLKKRATVSVT
jgi:hypothetical protein